MPYVDPKPTPREAIAAGFAILSEVYEINSTVLAMDTAFLDTSYPDFTLANDGVWQNFNEEPELEPWQVRMNGCEFLIVFADQALNNYIQLKLDNDPEYEAPDLSALANAIQGVADDAYNTLPPPE